MRVYQAVPFDSGKKRRVRGHKVARRDNHVTDRPLAVEFVLSIAMFELTLVLLNDMPDRFAGGLMAKIENRINIRRPKPELTHPLPIVKKTIHYYHQRR